MKHNHMYICSVVSEEIIYSILYTIDCKDCQFKYITVTVTIKWIPFVVSGGKIHITI